MRCGFDFKSVILNVFQLEKLERPRSEIPPAA